MGIAALALRAHTKTARNDSGPSLARNDRPLHGELPKEFADWYILYYNAPTLIQRKKIAVSTYLNIIQIIISITLMIIILIQVKGEGMGGVFGGDSGVARTRRGLERTLFNATIVLSAIFLLISFLSAYFAVRQ